VDPDFPELTVPHLILQSEINDLMRLQSFENSGGTLGFSPTGTEFVTARWYSVVHEMQQSSSLFSNDGILVNCNDVEELLQELGSTYSPEDWRIFVDSSKFS